MWERTKRLINSYLDNLIEKASSPDREVREITRAELARLNELEVQARASIKMMEKELAELELKLIGIAERERLAQERGDATAASSARNELIALSNHRDLLKQQIGEANASASRARALRSERRRSGEDLANETYLTSMRENLSSVQAAFDPNDPAAVIDEMRSRLGQRHAPTTDALVSEADRELEAERARSRVDELLARYKESTLDTKPAAPAQEAPRQSTAASEDKETEQPKTLGRVEGPVRPID